MVCVRTFLNNTIAGVLGMFAVAAASPAIAAEKVMVAVFPSVSALPFYVARERGYFAAEGIDAEAVIMQSHPRYMNTPAALAPTVPLVGFAMVRDLKEADIADFQKFVDFAVSKSIVPEPVDVRSMIKPL